MQRVMVRRDVTSGDRKKRGEKRDHSERRKQEEKRYEFVESCSSIFETDHDDHAGM